MTWKGLCYKNCYKRISPRPLQPSDSTQKHTCACAWKKTLPFCVKPKSIPREGEVSEGCVCWDVLYFPVVVGCQACFWNKGEYLHCLVSVWWVQDGFSCGSMMLRVSGSGMLNILQFYVRVGACMLTKACCFVCTCFRLRAVCQEGVCGDFQDRKHLSFCGFIMDWFVCLIPIFSLF